jgi:hypothetical protein
MSKANPGAPCEDISLISREWQSGDGAKARSDNYIKVRIRELLRRAVVFDLGFGNPALFISIGR